MSEKHEKKETNEKSATKEPKNANVQEITQNVENLMDWFISHEGI